MGRSIVVHVAGTCPRTNATVRGMPRSDTMCGSFSLKRYELHYEVYYTLVVHNGLHNAAL